MTARRIAIEEKGVFPAAPPDESYSPGDIAHASKRATTLDLNAPNREDPI